MSGLLRQMFLFLTEGKGKQSSVGRLPQVTDSRPLRHGGKKTRDPLLEDFSRSLLSGLAPGLATRITVGWNPSMRTTAGVAIVNREEVWLNPALRSIPGGEIDRTLRHELAHLLAQHRAGRRRIAPHGSEWRQACSDLGIPGEERTHKLPFQSRRLDRRYLLVCPSCGASHRRVRPPRRPVACLRCCRAHNRGLYDGRFRLRMQDLKRDENQSMSPK